MGLCFSYQQTKDFELRLSSLFELLIPRDDFIIDGGDSNDTVGSRDCDGGGEADRGDVIARHDTKPPTPPEPTRAERKKKPKTYESRSVQVDLGFTEPTNPSTLTTTPTQQSTPTTLNNSEALAQEERRRRREERRAARNAHNEDKLKLELNLRSPSEYLDERCKLDVHIFKGFDAGKKCLVLDIDYTIFDHKSDFELAPEYKRPYLHEFLKTCSEHYNIVIWSATAFYHVHTKMDKLQLLNHPDFQICGALSKDHMIPHTFSVKRKTFVQDIKPLALLWRKFPDFFDHCNTIHIDDVAENFALNPRNGLRIDPFREALVNRQTDKELFYLSIYLTMIASLPSFSSLDHSKWKDQVINTLWSVQTTFVLPSFTSPEPASALLLQQHEQAMILKQAIKEKLKEREREERAKEREREERAKVEQEIAVEPGTGTTKVNVGSSSSSSRGFGSIVTEVMTSVAMEVVAEVVTEEITKGAMEAAMEESMDTTWSDIDDRSEEKMEQAEEGMEEGGGGIEAMDPNGELEPTMEEEELAGMGGVQEPLDVQILLTTALADHHHPHGDSNYEEQASKERVGRNNSRGNREWENERDWSREDLEVQHIKEMNAQAVF